MKTRDHFGNGFAAAMAVHSLIEDYIGQDGMREMVDHHWVSGGVTVPLAVLVLVVIAVYYALSHLNSKQ